MIKIGDFSKLSRISIRMLRYYDEKRLLIPANIDIFTGYRYYNAEQLTLANKITALKDMGFSLDTISEILIDDSNPEIIKKYMLQKQIELRNQVEECNRRLLLLETSIKRLGKGENSMNYSVTLKEFPSRRVMSLREIIPSYEDEGMLWHKMMEQTAPQNVQIPASCQSLAIFHDTVYKEQDVDVEIQINVVGDYKNTKDVVFKTADPIKFASATFKGGYEKVGAVYEAIANWVSDNHYEFFGSMFNIYHVGPATEQNPDNWVTEVCCPVK